MKRYVMLALCASAFTGPLAAAEPTLVMPQLEKPAKQAEDGDPLHEKYEAAWDRYEKAIGEVRDSVNAALDAVFEKAADAGNLELADMWDKKKRSFADTGAVNWESDPKAKLEWKRSYGEAAFPNDLAALLRDAKGSCDAALAVLKADYQQLVSAYTKERNLGRARALKEEAASLGHDKSGPKEPSSDEPEAFDLTTGQFQALWQFADPATGGNWSLNDGVLVCAQEGSSLVSKRSFRNFVLDLEFLLPPRAASGVYLRGCYEVQLVDSMWRDRTNQPADAFKRTGAIFGQIPADRDAYVGPNKWNRLSVRLVGKTVSVTLNGDLLIDRQQIRDPANVNTCGDPDEGPVVLQYALPGGARFKNVRVTPIE